MKDQLTSRESHVDLPPPPNKHFIWEICTTLFKRIWFSWIFSINWCYLVCKHIWHSSCFSHCLSASVLLAKFWTWLHGGIYSYCWQQRIIWFCSGLSAGYLLWFIRHLIMNTSVTISCVFTLQEYKQPT